jgi:hypothetical protein
MRSVFAAWGAATIFLVGLSSLAIAKDCFDDEAYTLYFYSASDASVLKEQRCENASGQSEPDKLVETKECRCYNMGFNQVSERLKTESPVGVRTKRLIGKMATSGAMSCKVALENCEKACQEQTTDPQVCAPVVHAGLLFR